MSEWKTVRLGDVCEILDSKRVPITAHERKNGSYPYYGANGIQDYVADYIFDDELVLLAEDGGNFGSKEKPIAYRVSGKCWVNNHAHVLKPKECLDVDYLCDSIKFYDVSTIVNGATRQKLTQSAMVEMKIFLPPLETQKQIAKQLNKCTTLLAKHKQMLETYDTLIKSRFIEMFGEPVLNPKKWNIEKLKTLTSKIGSGATPKGGRESYISEGISLVRSMNVYKGYFEYEGLAHITEDQARELDNVTLQENDVLINITGASVARCCILPKDVLPARVNQHVSILRATEKLNPVYLSNLLITDTEQRVLLGIGGAGGATREAITKTELETLNIPVPPLSLQNDFASFVQQIDKSKFTVQKSLEKAETLYKSLMQEYFA